MYRVSATEQSRFELCWKVGNPLTHWGRVTQICVGKIIIIGSDNGLSPDRRQAIIWTNAGLWSIEPLRTYFSENLIKIQPFSLKKIHVKMSSAKWRPSCLGPNVLISLLLKSSSPHTDSVNKYQCTPAKCDAIKTPSLRQKRRRRRFDVIMTLLLCRVPSGTQCGLHLFYIVYVVDYIK